jgi:polar amino acid transport system permease protein
MNSFQFDWSGVLTGVPATWLLSGLLNTLLITIVGSVVASVLAILLLLMRTSESRCLRYPAQAVIMAFRNTPLLVQLFFWYFAAYPALPEAFRDWVISDHWFSPLPDGFRFLSPEFICAWLGLSWFCCIFSRGIACRFAGGVCRAGRSRAQSRFQSLEKLSLYFVAASDS